MRETHIFARSSPALRAAFAAGLALLLVACFESRPALVQVPVPDAGALEASVQRAFQRARTEVDRVANAKAKDEILADAYGELAMTYHAQSLLAPAEAAYANARALAPREKRWPYLLGHLYNDSSRVTDAIAAFESARALDENDVPVLFSLGQAYLQHGEFDKAESMFRRLESHDEARAPALAGLGKVALAKRNYKDAVKSFEDALSLAPTAARLRQPLAMAYQGLGERAKAEENLRRYVVGSVEPEIEDPMAEALGAKVAGSHALTRRGQRFARAGRFDVAEQAFRTAVEADPRNAEAIANLGIVLANLDRLEEARLRLTEALGIDDTNAFWHLALAVVFDRQGLDAAATEQYAAALSRDPANVQAKVYLADLRMRTGAPEEAARLYRDAMASPPASARLALSLAIANVKARRYGDARKVLEAAVDEQPGNAELVNALARLLASAPDSSVRDGKRALALSKTLFEGAKNPEIGQTYAMALAETGNFSAAVQLQRETMVLTERAGASNRRVFMQRNLDLYERRKPAREAWPAGDPMFQPRSPATRLAKAPAP